MSRVSVKRPRLHPSWRGEWCGPSALAAVSGLGYQAARDILTEARAFMFPDWRRQQVKGVTLEEMSLGLRRVGVKYRGSYPWDDTVETWLDKRANKGGPDLAVLLIPDHFVAVRGPGLVDNHETTPLRARYGSEALLWVAEIVA
jgi:hypothetical protein